jgi:hypothetical protein
MTGCKDGGVYRNRDGRDNEGWCTNREGKRRWKAEIVEDRRSWRTKEDGRPWALLTGRVPGSCQALRIDGFDTQGPRAVTLATVRTESRHLKLENCHTSHCWSHVSQSGHQGLGSYNAS